MTIPASIAEMILTRFPWMARFGLTAKGDLEIKSATSKIDIAGGDAAIGRVGDGCTRLAFYPGIPASAPPVLYYSNSASPPYAWSVVALPLAAPLPPTPTDPGTLLQIVSGSSKVRSG